jgi:hypothetical protein
MKEKVKIDMIGPILKLVHYSQRQVLENISCSEPNLQGTDFDLLSQNIFWGICFRFCDQMSNPKDENARHNSIRQILTLTLKIKV